MLKKIISIAMVVIGIAVIILGTGLMGESTSAKSFSHTAAYNDADGASFGGDFYTYIYEASDIIVDELYSIDKGISVMVEAQNYQIKKAAETTDAVYKVGGTIVLAIGLAIVASGLAMFAVAFTRAPKAPQPFVPEYPVQM